MSEQPELREVAPATADLLIATFFQKWSPAPRDVRARFHLDFVRIVQQITLEAARPYHMLLRDALSQQPLMARTLSVPRDEPELKGSDE